MKKTASKFLLSSFLLVLCLVSCKKQELAPVVSNPNAGTLNSVINWLEIQKKSVNDSSSAANISYLRNGLVAEQVVVQTINDSIDLVIIPLKDEFKTANLTKKHSFKGLVAVTGKNTVIKTAAVVEIIPDDEQYTTFPVGIISQVYLNAQNQLTGTASYLTISNKIMEERKYGDGKILSIKYLSKRAIKHAKGENAKSQRTEVECTDWYWQTYINGELVSEEYAFTTCSGGDECQSTRTMDSPSPFKLNCGGGGGNGGEIVTDYNESVTEDEPNDSNQFFGVAPKITYVYSAHIARINGIVSSIIQDPVTISNLRDVYIDPYGRSTVRILTQPFGQINTPVNLGTSALLEWTWFVYGRWIYDGGADSFQRTWSGSHMAVG